MDTPLVLLNCVRMHRKGDNALSGNFFLCLKLVEAIEAMGRIDLHVHVDAVTLPYLSAILPGERLVIEDRRIDSIGAMELSIYRAIKELQPDLYHKPTGQLPLIPIPCKAIWGVADLNYRHLKLGWLKHLYKQISYRSSARRADRILAISDSTRKQIINALGAAPAKVHTVYLGTNSFNTKAEAISGLPDKFAITFGHHSHKNVAKVIEAVSAVRANGTQMHLIVVGSLSNRDELERAATECKMNDHVTYTGHIKEGQLRFLYENAVCLVFLSRHEGFGLPVLEAMGSGCPVISSDAFALPEVVGDAAPIFDCDNHLGVAAEIQRFTDDAAYRESWIAKGHTNTTRFTWKRTAEETIAIYEDVLNS